MEMADAQFERAQSLDEHNEENGEKEDVLGLIVYLGIRAMDKYVYEIPFFDVEEKKLHSKHTWPLVLRAARTALFNSWSSRIWVVQETVLACQATVVYCNIIITWTVITDEVSLSDRQSARIKRQDNILIVDGLEPLNKVCEEWGYQGYSLRE
ncbi:hypothetical protein G6011_05874 [Alternaria panax]|uniref:Heterokaryon incompatibility domain-containing protein n=1 Tax=Alternaria panax TaxID=48097 RepID=A0AAD4FG37_9PLEO|nr:hypothetical protein G6011_05874 [Alternaria panax]